jgi:hypothetical protein
VLGKTRCCCEDRTVNSASKKYVVVNTEWEMLLGTQGVVVKTEKELC